MSNRLAIRIASPGEALDAFEAAWNRTAEEGRDAPLSVLAFADLPLLLATLTESLDDFGARGSNRGLLVVATDDDLDEFGHRRDRNLPGDGVVGTHKKRDALSGSIDLHGGLASVEHVPSFGVAFVKSHDVKFFVRLGENGHGRGH